MNEQVSVDIKVNNVKFMMPVLVDFEIYKNPSDGQVGNLTISGSLDMANQEFVSTEVPEELKKLLTIKVFNYLLNESSKSPSFEADSKVYEQAAKANEECNKLMKDHNA